MRTHLRLELLDARDLPAVTLDQPAEAFSFVLVNELRRDPAGFANKLDGLRRGTISSAFGFTKADPVVADLGRLIQYSTWPGHYAVALKALRSTPATGPLGWDDLLEDRAGLHNDWMRTHSFEHTGQDLPTKSYIPGFNTGYRGGSPDAWGYSGQYYWWGEDIGYTYGLLANSKAAYAAGRFGRIGFQERAAFIDMLSYVLEVNSPDMAHLHQLLAPDGGPDWQTQMQFNAVGMDLDFYEAPSEIHDGLGEATISTHRFGLYRPNDSGGFLTGVAFRDGNSNGVYDAGEGIGVQISVSGPVSYTDTLDRLATQGVYSRYLPNGIYSVSAVSADGSNLGSRTVTIVDRNAWFEFVAPTRTVVATRATVTAPVGTTGVRPTVTWTEIPDSLGYLVRLTDRTTGRVSVYPGSTTVGPAWAPPSDLIPGHSYSVVVRGLMAYHDSEWSPAWDFTVGTPQAVGPGVNAATLRPAISWAAISGASAYVVNLDDLTTGLTNVFPGQRTTNTSWVPPADLVCGRSYTVRVRAVNSHNLGLWGPATTFSIAVPILSGPSGTIGTTNPIFAWSTINGAARYVLVIDDLTAERRVDTTSIINTSWQPPVSLVNGHAYRWQVAAYNAAGLGRWSLPSEFRVEL